VAEASRNALREMGINTTIRGTTEHGGGEFFQQFGNDFTQATVGPTTGLIDVLAGFPHADLEILLEAMAENQYLQILAKPNLTALSGEEASFLAGGEFPIPVVQGGSGGNSASISIEYKEFGIRLAFRPTVLGDGKIRLEVSTEVSDITDVGSVELQGFRVPAIITRRAETTLQLGSGQTFGMAGLIQQNTEGSNARLPLLGDLPVLGPFFRSVRYSRGETELVVLVRASLVEPLSLASDVPLPGDLHVSPTDAELYGEGRLERKASHDLDPPDAAWRQALGVEGLKSPGVWTRYGSARTPSRSTVKVRAIEKKESQEQEVTKKKKVSVTSMK
jgi:pilus assembly protein CpaC